MPQSALTNFPSPLQAIAWADFLNQGWKIGSNLSQLIEVVWNIILKNIWEPHIDLVRQTTMIDWQCLHWAGEAKLMARALSICQKQHLFYFLKEKISILQIVLTSYPNTIYVSISKIQKSRKISTDYWPIVLKNLTGKTTCVACKQFPSVSSKSEQSQNRAKGPHPAYKLFYMIHELRMIFTFLKDWDKIKKLFCDT